MAEIRVLAHHAHVFPAEKRPGATVEKLLEFLEEIGAEGAVCFAPTQQDSYSELDSRENSNDWLAKRIADKPNLYGFGRLNFEQDDLKDQVRHIASLGFKGIKIHPATQNVPVLSVKARQVYAEAERLGLMLTFHTGVHHHPIEDYHPLLFDRLNWDYPELKFSMEHIGGFHFFRDALAVLQNGKHGFAGWTSIDTPKRAGACEYQSAWCLTDAELMTSIAQIGVGRQIYGLDFPFKSAEYNKNLIARIKALPIADDDKAAILGGNLRGILGI
ncbi:MAG: amidohydrolase family protein [Oscillospiraceae bacterium]|jgi:predicted TIM-barrel fold metal-dependent hydrolase|nr:amidohydrolase family protein [Oscillospiraceae bacterium]